MHITLFFICLLFFNLSHAVPINDFNLDQQPNDDSVVTDMENEDNPQKEVKQALPDWDVKLPEKNNKLMHKNEVTHKKADDKQAITVKKNINDKRNKDALVNSLYNNANQQIKTKTDIPLEKILDLDFKDIANKKLKGIENRITLKAIEYNLIDIPFTGNDDLNKEAFMLHSDEFHEKHSGRMAYTAQEQQPTWKKTDRQIHYNEDNNNAIEQFFSKNKNTIIIILIIFVIYKLFTLIMRKNQSPYTNRSS